MKRRLGLGFLAFLSIGIALAAPTPWLLGVFEGITERPPLLEHLVERHDAARVVFLLHILGGAVALLAGPWQLMPRLRARRPRLHRATGYAYVSAVAVAGVAGLVMGPTAWGGPAAQLGFTSLAILWLATTGVGLRRILAGDRAGHRAWITCSYALAFAAVSLRLQMPLFGVLGVPDAVAYPIAAWSCWVPNLILVRMRQGPVAAGACTMGR